MNKTLTKEEILRDAPSLKMGMDQYAEQEAIGFFIWYGIKFHSLMEYITKIKPMVESYELEQKVLEFEGKSIKELYQLYLQSKKEI